MTTTHYLVRAERRTPAPQGCAAISSSAHGLDAYPDPNDRFGTHAAATFEAIAYILERAAARPEGVWAKGRIELTYHPEGVGATEPDDVEIVHVMEAKA